MAQFYQSIKGAAALGTPVGTIIPYTAASTPAGFLLCDGTAVSRTTYAALFAVVGTTYGAGDGSSTFNLPDLAGRVPIGRDGSTYNEGATGGSANVTPNVSVTDNIAVNEDIAVTDNIAVNKTGTVSISSSVGGNPTKTGTVEKSGTAAGNLSGAPDAGNLATSIAGNVFTNNTTLSSSQVPAHNHGILRDFNPGPNNAPRVFQHTNRNSKNPNSGQYPGNFAPDAGNTTINALQSAFNGGSHGHGAGHNLSGSMTGAPGLGTLAVSVTDNIGVTDNISVSAGNLAVTNTDTDNIAVSKSGTVSKSGSVTKSGTVSANASSVSTVQPYTGVRYAIKF